MRKSSEIGGAYSAERAAALSGVPKSTIHYWARRDLIVPSVAQKPRIWSFTDLLALRTVYWLRQPKTALDLQVPPTSMPKVRRALKELRALTLDLFEHERPIIRVSLSGDVVIAAGILPLQKSDGQYLLEPGIVDLLAPFDGLQGTRGPDLSRPRPTLRILPRKISGAPHVEDTRLPTQSLFALASRGYEIETLAKIYPFVSIEALRDSIELEKQLQQNLKLAA
ncbi:MAG: DUF433 domain-containing protein [Thermoanaerobaculia bacterium]